MIQAYITNNLTRYLDKISFYTKTFISLHRFFSFEIVVSKDSESFVSDKIFFKSKFQGCDLKQIMFQQVHEFWTQSTFADTSDVGRKLSGQKFCFKGGWPCVA